MARGYDLRAFVAAFVAAALLCGAPAAILAQAMPEASRAPAAGGLTPEELKAQQEQIVKESQNPVGNIAIIPFQNNFNYGAGPYNRLQYVLNLQPVVPIMINLNLNVIARTII